MYLNFNMNFYKFTDEAYLLQLPDTSRLLAAGAS